MLRLFSGIEIPDDIRIALADLRQPLPGARWIEPENFHITLRFAGDVPPVSYTHLRAHETELVISYAVFC